MFLAQLSKSLSTIQTKAYGDTGICCRLLAVDSAVAELQGVKQYISKTARLVTRLLARVRYQKQDVWARS